MSNEKSPLPTHFNTNTTKHSNSLSQLLKVLLFAIPAVLFAAALIIMNRRPRNTRTSPNEHQKINSDSLQPILRNKRSILSLPSEYIVSDRTGTGDYIQPHLAICNSNQDHMIIWYRVNDGPATGFASYFNADAFNLSNSTIAFPVIDDRNLPNPNVACNTNNGVIAWSDTDGSNQGVYVQKFSTINGSLIGNGDWANKIVKTNSQYQNDLSQYQNGNLEIIWSSNDGSPGVDWNIRGGQLYNNLTAIVPERLMSTFNTAYQEWPKLAVLSDDNSYATTWMTGDSTQDGSGYAIKVKIYHRNGSIITDEFVANNITTGNQNHPDISKLSYGFIVAYEDASTGSSAIRAQRFNMIGRKIGSEILVTDSKNSLMPSVVSFSNDAFSIGYHTGDPDQEDVFLQLYNPNGVSVGKPFRINSITTGSQKNLHLDVFKNEIRSVWQGDLSGKYDIYSRSVPLRLELTNPNSTVMYTEDTERLFYPNPTPTVSFTIEGVTLTANYTLSDPSAGELKTAILVDSPFTFNKQKGELFFKGDPNTVNILSQNIAFKPALDKNGNVTVYATICLPDLDECKTGTIKMIGIPVEDLVPSSTTPAPAVIQKNNTTAIIVTAIAVPVAIAGGLITFGVFRRRKSLADKEKVRDNHPLAEAVRVGLGLKGASDFESGDGQRFLIQVNEITRELTREAGYLEGVNIKTLGNSVRDKLANYLVAEINKQANFKDGKRLNENEFINKRSNIVNAAVDKMKADGFDPKESNQAIEEFSIESS